MLSLGTAALRRRFTNSAKSSRKPRRVHHHRRAVFFEALESRHLLSATFLDTEDNDSLAAAQAVVSPGLSVGVVDMFTASNGSVVTGDPDYYSFQAAVPGQLRVSVAFAAGSGAMVTFYDNADNVIGAATTIDSNNPLAPLTVTGVDPADVYKVGIDGDNAEYQLRIWNPDANEASGGDNSQATATNLGSFTGAAITSADHTITRPDRDFFELLSDVAGPIEIRAIMPAGTGAATGANSPTNLGIRVRDASGVILATSNGTTTDVDLATFAAVAGQAYFIEVYSGSVGQVNQYDLEISQPTATVTGFKYLDVNGDGFQDWGEPGLADWTIYVDANDNSVLDTGETSVTTASDGSYSLTLPPGMHVIREVLPTGWAQTYPGPAAGHAHRIHVSASMLLDHIDFGNFQSAIKSGTKFEDLNANGQWDANEPGLPGWTINLVGSDVQGNPVNLSTTTDSNGAYSFSVPPGTYTVSEVLQSGWTQSYPASGTYAITLTSGQVEEDNDFGNYRQATKSGVKFEDLNGNGVRDAGEPGLPGWTINLVGSDGMGNGVNLSTTTDSNGAYSFSVAPGTYTVSEEQQAGWIQSYPASSSYVVTLTSGEADEDNDFGNFRQATKSGVKFEDINGNSLRDTGEPGLPDWTINLVGTDGMGNAVSKSTTTDANGVYSFSVPPGTYTVSEALPSGWTQSYPAAPGTYTVTLASGEEDSGNDFGNFQNATKSGMKFHDLNGNGVNDGEPGLAGWTITLTGANGMGSGVNLSTVTDSNGAYSFSVPPGVYTVNEVLQSGWTQSYPASGSYVVTLTSGQVDDNNDFGNFRQATKTGVKFEDLDGDGERDTGEPGVSDWIITLNGTDGRGNVVGLSATTDANGDYSFSVPPGTYTVGEMPQSGWTQSYPASGSYSVTLVSGQADEDNDFGNFRQATKSGVKFEDLNGNGLRDAGEPGLSGWTINLVGTDGMGNAVSLNTTTGVNGAYSFIVPPGTYTVSEGPQGGWTQSYPATPGTYTVTLASGEQDSGNDFGNFQNATESGMKFHDLNGNGVNDGEPGLPGWTITLSGTDGLGNGVSLSTTTDSNGAYAFSVPPGTYTVSEVLQSGWTQSYPASGTYVVTLASGEVDAVNNFGNFRQATKSGMKFHDLDRNGTLDAGDPGLPGWKINLSGTDGMGNAINATTTTDANGNYSFVVPPGTYAVYETPQANWTQTAPLAGPGVITAPNSTLGYLVTLVSGQADNDNHFGNAPTPAFTGSKYYDANENGGRDVGEPGLPGWTIELFADVDDNGIFEPKGPFGVVGPDGDPVATAMTDANGNYSLGSLNLPSGRYFVRETIKMGWKQTSSPTYYSVLFTQGTAYPTPLEFGNSSCVTDLFVPDGQRIVTAYRDGLLTLVLSQGTFTVTRVDVPGIDDGGNGIVDDAEDVQFDAYDRVNGGVLEGVTSVESKPDAAGQRVDILIGAQDYLHDGAHPTPPGTQFVVNITGSDGAGALAVLNAVNVDVAGSLALIITGTECGELIAVADDTGGTASDAKAIYFGTVEGEFNGGADLASEGIKYNTPILDAMFGIPTISRVEVYAGDGDDIIRVTDEIVQQTTLDAGPGNDNIRAGSGRAYMAGGAGHDLLVGGLADDIIYGGSGQDRIFGGAGADRAYGDAGNDWIAGGIGDDALLRGGEDDDRISGGLGRDRLYGDAGYDDLYRDAVDYLVDVGANGGAINSVPPDFVEQDLLDLIAKYWDDADADAQDTLDELIASILP